MKTEHKAPEMSGIFKELAENFISFKRNLGFKYQSEEKVMSRFCRFSNDYDLTEVCITKKLAEDWIAPRAGETGKSRAHRLTCVRQFGEYLYTLGYEVYFLPEQRGMWTASFVPYIFTHEQIIALFAAADNTKFCDDRRNIQNCLPVIFRMLYGCGLRVSEALKLQVKDVNLTDGILTIKGAKMDRDRLIPMSESLTQACQKYAEAPKKQLSLTEVRAVLAEKSRAGFTKEVKELLIKHGADKLSEINPDEYEALLTEVEVLGNG